MRQLELEGISGALLREGGQDDDAPPRLAALVQALLGPGAITPVAGLRTDGELARVHDAWRIFVRRGLGAERRAFVVAHELAEWWLKVRERYQGPDVEHAANYVAAAILTPRRAFATAVRAVGRDFEELASVFHTSETLVALREAEIDRIPRAVVTPQLVRVRGPEEWIWPDEGTVRGWARRTIPGVRKTRLTDDPRRVVLDAEDVG